MEGKELIKLIFVDQSIQMTYPVFLTGYHDHIHFGMILEMLR